MELQLRPDDAALQARARRFADEVLQPLELECEEHDGLTPASAAAAKQAVLDHGFAAINHTVEDGGQGLDTFQVMLVEEQWGRVTNALWDVPWRPSIPLAAGTEEQKERFLRPACRGERRDAYAITEEGAGSDVTMVATTARRDGDAWVLEGEKWHVTSGDVADFFLVHAHVDGDPAKATVFLVDKDMPGVRLVRTPKYTHTFVFEHPIFAFEGVRVDGRPGARRDRRGVRPHEGLVRRGAPDDRRADGRRRTAVPRRVPRLRRRATTVRGGDRGLPGDRHDARRHGGRDHGREVAPVPRLLGGGARRDRSQTAPRRSERGQALLLRDRRARGRPCGADLRRPRLHARVRGRAALARAARRPDLGGHERDPATRRHERAPQARDARLHRVARTASSRRSGSARAARSGAAR